eukprot:TRINITY_DN22746_c0_g2_i1.p1 TRINITY_DN22746_c0_g2~~TRINITY_DN22746_c0_g2_i1.p1  ORF type:complete len:305 (+),score=70.49 TRINITY_DN22746_c0_g2_i1:74-988(+)
MAPACVLKLVASAAAGFAQGNALLRQVPLAYPSLWQAAEPVAVNVDYDVPSHGTADLATPHKLGSSAAFLAATKLPQALLADQLVWQAAEPVTVNVEYDVPTHSASEVIESATKAGRGASFMSSSVLPQAPLADQPVWQAAEPLKVNVDYDVPTHSATDAIKSAAKAGEGASFMSASVLPQAPLADQAVWQAAEPVTVNIDYDVPTHSAAEVMKSATKAGQGASFLSASVLPQAPLADQPVWQAAEPVTVNIDYDVPTHSAAEVMKSATKAGQGVNVDYDVPTQSAAGVLHSLQQAASRASRWQ